MVDSIREAWERRSKQFRDAKEAVMQQSFPSVINDYIHRIHIAEIQSIVKDKKIVCLDVGCGYGRISKEISQQHKNIFIYGIDISQTFVQLFNKALGKKGKAVVSDMRHIPFPAQRFDAVWIVASLMYLSTLEDRTRAVAELSRVLKPGGKLVIIEPNRLGVHVTTCWGLFPYIYRHILHQSKKIETFGAPFPWGAIDRLLSDKGVTIEKKHGYPFLTLVLTPLVVCARTAPGLAKYVLTAIHFLDRMVPIAYFSSFITYVATKDKK